MEPTANNSCKIQIGLFIVGDRLHNVVISVGDTSTSFPTQCGTFAGPAINAQVVYIPCMSGTKGRYLRVQIIGHDGLPDNVLTICELEIHGQK